MTAAAPAPRGPRRRTSAEVQHGILTAARDAFAGEGYDGTATRRIAAAAGVAETLIFRHFGSKAGLYRVAILESSPWLIREFRWTRRPEVEPETSARNWANHVLTVVEGNRVMLAGLLNHGLPITGDPELTAEVQAVRRELFRVLDRGARDAVGRATPGVGIALAARSAFATFVSVSAYAALFDVPDPDALDVDSRAELVRLAATALLAAATEPGRSTQASGA